MSMTPEGEQEGGNARKASLPGEPRIGALQSVSLSPLEPFLSLHTKKHLLMNSNSARKKN